MVGLTGGGGVAAPTDTACSDTSTEVCDGKDNDCDDKIDEDFPIGNPCSVDKGECSSLGVWACASDNQKAICDAPPFDMSDEICDGKDNDCDGNVDETFAFETNPDHCGGCDQARRFDNAQESVEKASVDFGIANPALLT